MSNSITSRIQFFDPSQEYRVATRRLPHWSQAGTICFVTWRTWDSMPRQVLERWLAERDAFLKRHGIDPTATTWRRQLKKLQAPALREFQVRISNRWNEHLDAGHGSCVLRRAELAHIVDESLRHFDGDRYQMTDFVIMPNHIHVLVAFPSEEAMLLQCESWKRYTATQINRILTRRGRFWQQEDFDHLVRSPQQFARLRRYIADNPIRARLKEGEFVRFSRAIQE